MQKKNFVQESCYFNIGGDESRCWSLSCLTGLGRPWCGPLTLLLVIHPHLTDFLLKAPVCQSGPVRLFKTKGCNQVRVNVRGNEQTTSGCRVSAVFSGVVRLFTIAISIAFLNLDSKVCMKRSEVGYREGNLYSCEDPRLSECCERDSSFLCCEPEWQKILISQIWMVSTLLAIFLALLMVYVCYNRQEEVFESETAREAALRWKHRVQRAYTSVWSQHKVEGPGHEPSRYSKLPGHSRAAEQTTSGSDDQHV